MSAVTPTHQRVQAAPSSGINLSAGLKSRLKRCGRYHSATPSAKKPCIAASWSPKTQRPSSVVLPITPQDIHQAFTSKGDNSKLSNTPKPPSCSRRMRTSLSFKSPVMKTMSYGPGTGPAEGIGAAVTPQGSETSGDECCSGMDPSTPLSSKHKRLSQTGNKNRLKFSSDLDKVDQQSADCHDQTDLHSVHNDDKAGLQSVACSDDSVQQSVACCDKASIQSIACSHKSVQQSVICRDKTSLRSVGRSDMATMRREKRDLTLHLTAVEEKLRKLNMVKMYRSKNNLQQLQSLIDKWRGVTQQALSDLHNMLPQPRPSLPDFVKHLQIDTDLVELDLEVDSED
ncbi:swi5-dependent recombination DNA repair protein 1 homolog [Haliotis rubra]|uniref:swi5-dependent recombination DNA repair protein 1 homolog n=1 Tax=Haliotis rubra TaxID=36100 RepID=UPI001EE61D6B|nr:swi5-dependent recombination DNA repair protein 1 homolog [Haliotis rubra]XP_046576891.1 swi5-dependent recombination DNA repair protein 1 homolog [Haliotis rubra]